MRLLYDLQRISAALALSVLLTACSSPAPHAFHPNAEHASWSGRLGLQIDDPSANAQSFSASFQLQGNAQQGRLDIFNPLGTQLARLEWMAGSAQLQQGDRITQSESLQELLQVSTGTALPVQALFGWLNGQAIVAEGWEADLSRHQEGRITAYRRSPLPQAILRVILQ